MRDGYGWNHIVPSFRKEKKKIKFGVKRHTLLLKISDLVQELETICWLTKSLEHQIKLHSTVTIHEQQSVNNSTAGYTRTQSEVRKLFEFLASELWFK
ncbi:Hypothetical predicted protein [Octopus vulgaris]|uniref:Uncharacterized protein n=1 Tax=Octopus vulgaris TaxID=6645 RepID=A0AA36FCF2_OCTVU|nr:Hypothetical predicted protein [Octopus vulgaris]